MKKIDELDMNIINELRSDARISIQEISKKLNRRRATIHARISKLLENEIIKGSTIIPDFKKLGYGITVFVLVAISEKQYKEYGTMDELSQKISEIPQVTEIHSLSGEYDYLLKIRVNNLETLGKDIIFTLRKEYGAIRTLTLTSFYTGKEELGNDDFRFLNLPNEL